MIRYKFGDLIIGVDFEKGRIESVVLNGTERSVGITPLFRAGLRDKEGKLFTADAFSAAAFEAQDDFYIYKGFKALSEDGKDILLNGLTVKVSLSNEGGNAAWRISADPGDKCCFIEWVEFPLALFPKLSENNPEGTGGSVLFPYNEGVLVSDYSVRERSYFCHWPLVYPSYGSLAMFPNMVCSQFLAYLWNDGGIYFGAHDKGRAPKGIDYFEVGNGIEMRFRLYTGKDFGEAFEPDYPVVWAACGPNWQSAAAVYRDFFESNLPPRARKISENEDLPDWYKDSPLVVSYPVRGIHDMDKMDPNSFFPYVNALPVIDDIADRTKARLLVLLMHWEGTAPWAPPYVWPPYGGVKPFNDFLKALRERNMLLGVYCSGFSYTLKSNVVDDYDRTEEFEARHLIDIMCAGPDGKILLSNICPGQRSGYDICPATETGKEILSDAYTPLFDSGVDYAQILDQNHGGSQYLCYARDHGHPAAPGLWMTANMQELLTSWNEKAGKMILGCESAAAEPYLGNLLLSDNRYEINYFIGDPVPMYAFIYHEYVRNFMGNQVCCPLEKTDDALNYRLAYSFAAGDCMTIVLNPEGGILSDWGTKDFTKLPSKDKALTFIAALTEFYRAKASKFLYNGKMLEPPSVKCNTAAFDCTWAGRTAYLPKVICTAWEAPDGDKTLIAVNPFSSDEVINVGGREVTVPGLKAILVDF